MKTTQHHWQSHPWLWRIALFGLTVSCYMFFKFCHSPRLRNRYISLPTRVPGHSHTASKLSMLGPKVLSAEELLASEAKYAIYLVGDLQRLILQYRWITLKKIKWSDPDGKEVSR